MMQKYILICILFIYIGALLGSTYYIATTGNDANPGTLSKPFATIKKAASVLKAGDLCYIRGGRYHEEARITNLHGKEEQPIIFMPYQDEKVTLDGSVPLNVRWTKYRDKIYKTKLDQDIWQLFVDDKTMISARWPNAGWEDGSIWEQTKTWAHQSDNSTNGHLINDNSYQNLAETGIDFTGAVAILNIGSWVTFATPVKNHAKGSNEFNYDPELWARLNDDYFWDMKKKQGFYFLECALVCLDTTGEWFYDSKTKELYFWPDNGENPEGQNVRGRTISYAIHLNNCSHVIFRGLDFFGSTFQIEDSQNVTLEDCNLKYPSYSKRMLGVLGEPDVTMIRSSKSESSENVLRNCEFAYTDGTGLKIQGERNLIENCYFHDIDYSCAGSGGWTVNGGEGVQTIFRRNTIHTGGASEGLKGGFRNLIEYNHIFDCGHLQSDGGQIQVSGAQQPGTVIQYNWVHNSAQANPFSAIKFGIRFDGSFVGALAGVRDLPHSGTIHHNLVWNTQCMYVKGDSHAVYHNLCFDNRNMDLSIRSRTGLPIPKDYLKGYSYEHAFGPGVDHPDENGQTVTRNNLAGEISSYKFEQSLGLPGLHSNNWAGDVRNQLRDPDNLDFRPREGAGVIDAGYYIPGITGDYSGEAPDVGAYEYGSDYYWIPGRQIPQASTPIPPDGSQSVKADADLMWLEGYKAQSHDLYFGSNQEAVSRANHQSPEYKGNVEKNIYSLQELKIGETYFWRVDAVQETETVTGNVWRFTVQK